MFLEQNLCGFNNLTKVLSFNLYDFCITIDEKQRLDYTNWIHSKYNSEKILDISKKICEVIEANILNSSIKDYDPAGASTLVLMSDIKGDDAVHSPNTTTMNLHLDKSHITAHTYPDPWDPNGICTFRVDIDIATCGEIIPLKAINILFESFECDVVIMDYVVRGYTRLDCGKKIYNDHNFKSIQDFIDPAILDEYAVRTDLNMAQVNTWQTKLMVKDYGPERFLMDQESINHPQVDKKMILLQNEMKEIFNMLG